VTARLATALTLPPHLRAALLALDNGHDVSDALMAELADRDLWRDYDDPDPPVGDDPSPPVGWDSTVHGLDVTAILTATAARGPLGPDEVMRRVETIVEHEAERSHDYCCGMPCEADLGLVVQALAVLDGGRHWADHIELTDVDRLCNHALGDPLDGDR